MSQIETLYRTIISELIDHNGKKARLLQFGARASANQYLRLYRMVIRHNSPGIYVLDWGAGSGHFSYFLLRMGFRVDAYGFDNEPTFADEFKQENFTFTFGDKEDPVGLPYPDEAFDMVSSIGVLEHVRYTGGNELGSLLELARTLKPNGKLVCFHLPNKYSWIEFLLRRLGRWSHDYRYTLRQIEHLLSDAGFDLIEVQQYGALPRNMFWWLLRGRGESEKVASIYDAIDSALSMALRPITQNYAFVARKRA